MFVYICMYIYIPVSLQYFFLPFHTISLLSPPLLHRSHQQHSNCPKQISVHVSIGDNRETAPSFQIFILISYLSMSPQYCVVSGSVISS